MPDTVLDLITRVDVGPLKVGMADAAASVKSGAASIASALIADGESAEAAASALKNLGFSAAEAKSAVDSLNTSVAENAAVEEVATRAVRSGISERMAATASLRVLEGNLMGSTRAAGAFLTTTLGLGPALQAAFPVIGILALGGILDTVVKKIEEMEEKPEKIRVEWENLGSSMIDENNRLAKSFEDVLVKVTDLQSGKMAALDLQMQLLKADTSSLGAEMGKFSESIAKVVSAEGPWYESLVEIGRGLIIAGGPLSLLGDALQNISTSFKDTSREAESFGAALHRTLSAEGNIAGLKQIDAELTSVYQRLQAAPNDDALKKFRDGLEQMQAMLSKEASTKFEDSIVAGLEKSRAAAELAAKSAKQQLDQQLASIKRWEGEQHVAYESMSIDASQWAVDQKVAIDAANAANVEYFQRLQSLYAGAHEADKAHEAGLQLQAAETKQAADAAEQLGNAMEKYRAESMKTLMAWGEIQQKSVVKTFEEAQRATLELAQAQETLQKSQGALSMAQGGADYQAEINLVKEAAAAKVISKRQEANQLDAIYQKEKTAADEAINADITGQQKIVDAGRATATQMATLKGPDSIEWQQAQAAYDRDLAAYNELLVKKLNLDKEYDQKMAAADAEADKEMQKSLNDFVSQGTSAFNSFLVTITTTKGKGSEFRFLAEEWQKTVFTMEKDFLQMILRTAETTPVFTGITTGLKNTLANVFSKIGLGPAAGAAGGGIATASKGTDAAGMAAFNAALKPATLALTQMAAAAHAATTAEATEAPATQAVTAAKVAEAPATTATTIAQTAQVPAVASGTAAHAVHAPTVLASTLAHLEHAPAVAADTLALIAHKIATLLGFDEGGYVPRTGMAMLHKGERVATPDMWSEIGDMGKQGGDSEGGGHTFHINHNTNVSALDGADVSKILRKNSSKVGKELMRAIKSGSLRLPR